MNQVRNDIRNVAIIAHVDHGKTTLVDALLRQSGNFRDSQVQDTMLDSNPLERERGITILAKNVAINYLDPVTNQTVKINVINKIDRPDARADEVLNMVFDLFVELGADDETLDFPVLYASGRAGTASWSMEEPGKDIKPVFEALMKHIPAPHGDKDKSLQIRISSIQYNDYVGRIGVGRIYNGIIKSGQQVAVVKRDGSISKTRVQQLQVFDGFGRSNAEESAAGDIVALIGLETVDISDSIGDPMSPQPLEPEDV